MRGGFKRVILRLGGFGLDGEQESAAGWGVYTGEIGQLLLEILEAEIGLEGVGVFQEEFANRGQVSWGSGFDDLHSSARVQCNIGWRKRGWQYDA